MVLKSAGESADFRDSARGPAIGQVAGQSRSIVKLLDCKLRQLLQQVSLPYRD